MVIMNGFKINDTDINSLKIKCSSMCDRNELREYLNGCSVKESIGDVVKILNEREFTITVNKYGDIVLVVIEDNNNIIYYLFDEEVRYLNVTKGRNIELKIGNKLITNSSLDDSVNTSILIHFIDYLDKLQKNISFNLQRTILFSNLRIFDKDNSKIITENEDLILAQPKFYKGDIHKMHLNIISKKGLRVVGSIECFLKDKNESNFDYRGNLSFKIHQEYLNMGHERKALELLKEYIDECTDDINKVLYLAAKEEDELVKSIAISMGGKLEYEGSVPKSEPLNFFGKIKEVKLYRIG